ncbi:hypothetical protein T440DRAFT_500905 [Plenodomus tracheiphilus IPT5]|uniref:Uncharacterized protein n=1 Tax=Plenodomus tracheiphilus IPT5 TaxID=1408161 RepID=A0A6A7B036_9PLEO|nr:hypothetical protein T440DRAFT_500905 [Plenodomus tracheiphilus IPT5]
MPQAKRQKPNEGSGPVTETSGNAQSAPAKPTASQKGSDGKTVKGPDPTPYEYICMNRPFFDVDGENWRHWEDGKAERLEREEIVEKLSKTIFQKEEEAGIWRAPAAQHPGHKWIIMWSAYLKYDLLCRKAKYCDPDNFNMYLCNDWHGWGLQEIIENQLLDFDKAFREPGEKRLYEMWAVISAMGLWFNTAHGIAALYMNEDSETTRDLIGLVGRALITALDVVENEGELKSDSKLLDLSLVIGEYLEFAYKFPAMGIEGECMGKLDAKKGVFATDLRIRQLEKGDDDAEEVTDTDIAPEGHEALPITVTEDGGNKKENTSPSKAKPVSPPPSARKRKLDETKSAAKDKWQWDVKFKAYKKKRYPNVGGQHYDITKMSKKARAEAAFDGKDPLAGVSAKDLKNNLVDMV